MSGAEIVGFLLGGFPLLISAAEHYKEGFEPLVKWYRFRDDFVQFIDAVATQKLLFDQTLERFLISADIPDDELQKFMRDPNYEGWHRTELLDLLKKRLGPAYEVLMSTIRRMNKLLLELQEMLMVKTVENDEVGWKVEWAREGASRWNYQMKRIYLSFSKKGNATVEELERHNKKLAALLDSKDKLDSIKATRKDTAWASVFAGIRIHANSLYTALKNGWVCRCQVEHPTSLRLQRRKTGGWSSDFNLYFTVPVKVPGHSAIQREVAVRIRNPKEKVAVLSQSSSVPDDYLNQLRQDFGHQATTTHRPKLTPAKSDSSPRWSSVKSLSRNESQTHASNASGSEKPHSFLEGKTSNLKKWIPMKKIKKSVRVLHPKEIPTQTRTASVPQIQETHVAPEPCDQIQDLCSKLCSRDLDPCSLGYLDDSETEKQHELRYIRDSFHNDQSIVTLEALLDNPEALAFTRQHRYKTASILASSLLQLETTPWLQQHNFDKKMIFFFREHDTIQFDKPYVEHSFLSKQAASSLASNSTLPSPTLPPRFIARQSLNTLGTLLLELCFGKSVEKCEFRKYHLDTKGQAHAGTNWSTTRDWAMWIGEEDPRLEGVINCCVSDTLFLQGGAAWEKKEFVQAVYSGVVKPLEQLVEGWTAMTV